MQLLREPYRGATGLGVPAFQFETPMTLRRALMRRALKVGSGEHVRAGSGAGPAAIRDWRARHVLRLQGDTELAGGPGATRVAQKGSALPERVL